MAHRAKRWTCCDSRVESSRGCKKRHHVPPAEERQYASTVKRLTEDYAAKDAELDAELAEIDKADVVHVASRDYYDRIDAIAKPLEADRSIVARFKLKKMNKLIDDNALAEVIQEQHQLRREEFTRRYVTREEGRHQLDATGATPLLENASFASSSRASDVLVAQPRSLAATS